MSTVYIRDVSEDALTVMKVRAAEARQSLQAYVRNLIEREAATPTLREAAERAYRAAAMNTAGDSVSNTDVLNAIDAGRAGR